MAELAFAGGDPIDACCLCEAEVPDDPVRECALCLLTFHDACGHLVAHHLAHSPHVRRPDDADDWLCDWMVGAQLCPVCQQWMRGTE